MNREIKFRGIGKDSGQWIFGDLIRSNGGTLIFPEDAPDSYDNYIVKPETVGQFTGLRDRDGKDIYDGDIKKWYTVVSANLASLTGSDSVSHRAVMTWITEWSMWGWLMIDEYKEYMDAGVQSLDETMFWTYNADRDEEVMICGNIHQNQDLINQ